MVNIRPCPCCGANLGPRQIDRHLVLYGAHLTQLNQNSNLEPHPDLNTAPHPDRNLGNNPAPLPYIDVDPIAALPNNDMMDVEVNEVLGTVPNWDNNEEIPELMQEMVEGVLAELPPLEPVPIRRNPPVTVEDWPDPDDPNNNLFGFDFDFDFDLDSDCSSNGGEPVDSHDRDPPFVERGDEALGTHPEDELLMDDDMLRAFLAMDLGDDIEDQWYDLYNRALSERDYRTLRLLGARLRLHFSRQTWEDLRHGALEDLNLPSDFVAWRRLCILSGLETRLYDCCINSCICFLGRYAELAACPICDEPRFNRAGAARRHFRYTPLIPQLRALFRSSAMLKKLRYRLMAEEMHRPGVIEDIFDSEHYRRLRTTLLHETEGYHFFDNPNDITLGLSTDGFTLFKRRRRGHSTAWPILIINYNLHPSSRVRLENVICVGVIPGPKQCKDINSFLIPLLDELLELEKGVLSVHISLDNDNAVFDPDAPGSHFVLRAFLITLFGDIPAISKLLCMKGHNAKSPCRMCYIQGTVCRLARNSVYYVPLRPPNAEQEVSADGLTLRTHESFLAHYEAIEQAPTKAARQELAQLFGINARPVFSLLKSLDLAVCAPYDVMHLLFENLVPNMILHWTGKFKGLDEGTGNYATPEDHESWKRVGRRTANSARTFPSYFVSMMPDIAQDRHLFKAEAYSNWFQYLASVMLKDVLPDIYYEHYLLMREIIGMALQFEITYDELDELERMVRQWVSQYEEYYYQYETTRLPTCPLMIHALLHLPHTIRRAGPLWTSWAFVMERFCGHLLPAVKNRTRPYEYLNNYVLRRAQMQIVSLKYNLPSLAKPMVNYSQVHGEKITSRERIYPDFPTVVLGTPVCHNLQVTTQLTNQLTKYFGTVYYEMGLNGASLRARIDFDTLVRYGRFRLAGEGDRIRTASMIDDHPDRGSRDNTFVRYDLLPDANARYRNRPEVGVRRTHYGRVLDIYYVEFVVDLENPDDTREPYLLVRIRECQTGGLDAALRENPLATYRRMSLPEIIHIESINAAIGRVDLGNNTWAIVDRSRNGARTQFVEDGPEEDFD